MVDYSCQRWKKIVSRYDLGIIIIKQPISQVFVVFVPSILVFTQLTWEFWEDIRVNGPQLVVVDENVVPDRVVPPKRVLWYALQEPVALDGYGVEPDWIPERVQPRDVQQLLFAGDCAAVEDRLAADARADDVGQEGARVLGENAPD